MKRVEGFNYSFNASACATCGGRCCIGESGYIWVNIPEIEAIASYLNITTQEFAKEYLIRVKNRYSLKEIEVKELGYACIFFDIDKKMCKIYNLRPKQCRTFPFWSIFKDDTTELTKECPGVTLDEKN